MSTGRPKARRSADVLIVGAGPVGLALAGDLGWRGIDCVLIERNHGEITQPKMDLVGIRTMEFCRRWGIVGDVEASPYPRDYPQDNVYLTSLNGYELGRERFPSMGGEQPPPVSPQKRERCPQNMFDPILRKFANSFPSIEITYGQEFLGLHQDGSSVTAKVRDTATGEHYEMSGRYLVGCDGARSSVAQAIGAGYDGRGVLTYTTNVIFRTDDFNALHDKDPGYRYILIGPEGTWCTIVAINGCDRWRMSIVGDGTPRSYSDEELRAAAYRALGREFDLEILSIVAWTRAEQVAHSYRSGRVFAAGDAVHVMSPTGGFGMNTGIGDAVDLSWKLAAVLEGWAPSALLDSYQAERRPVAVRNVGEASGNLGRMLSPGRNPALLDPTPEGEETRDRVGRQFAEAMRREWFTLNIHLGYAYENSPIIVPDGTAPVISETDTYVPSARPGSRAPHVWLKDGRSTLDLFGRGFVLLDFGAAQPAVEDFIRDARAKGIPLSVSRLADEIEVAAAYGAPLVLVRPDGHVAWRGENLPCGLLRTVTGHAAQLAHTEREGEDE